MNAGRPASHPIPLDDAVEALLLASRALVSVAARSLAGDEEITLPQFRTLVLLAGEVRVTVTDIAQALDIHPSSATRLCDRLVRKGLIERVPSRDDRRVVEVHLAPDGLAAMERVTARRRRDLATIAGRMTDKELAGAVKALQAFTDAAGALLIPDLLGWDRPPPGHS